MPINKIKDMSDHDFKQHVNSCTSWPELMTRLGYKDFMSSGRKTIRKRIESLQINDSHLDRTSALMKALTDTQFESIVKTSQCWPELITQCGYKLMPRANEVGDKWNLAPFSAKKLIKERILRQKLSVQHFSKTPRHLRPTSKLMNRRKTGNQLKAILLNSGREYICEWCRCKHMQLQDGKWFWENKAITLQIDHINGISGKECDNDPISLRFLCPNCHSQTDNFAGKGQKTRRLIKKSCQEHNT